MGKKIIKATDTAGVVTYTEKTTTLVDDIVDGLTAPLSAVSSDDKTFVSMSILGKTAVMHLAAGIFVGDRYGESVPVLGQGRI